MQIKIDSGTSAYDEYWYHVKRTDIAKTPTHIAATRFNASRSLLALSNFSNVAKHMRAMEKFVTKIFEGEFDG